MIYHTIQDLKKKVLSKIYETYEIFQNFFGEQYTDLQGISNIPDLYYLPQNVSLEQLPSYDISDEMIQGIRTSLRNYKANIYVWWPHVTVTNESNRSVDIYDLYAKITIAINGTIPYEYRGFQLTRSTFPQIQYTSGYIHSHIPHFTYSYTPAPKFDDPCLGTGPIKNTILELHNEWNELTWMLFCQELSLYVTVESLKGGPYFKMEYIGNKSLIAGYDSYPGGKVSLDPLLPVNENMATEYKQMVADFIPYYLQHGHLSFNYIGGTFQPALSFSDYVLDVSNCFIEWFNTHRSAEDLRLLKSPRFRQFNTLNEVLAADGKFYQLGSTDNNFRIEEYNECYDVLTFKGQVIKLKILPSQQQEGEKTTIVHSTFAAFIIQHILQTINYHYKNEHRKTRASSARQNYSRVRYI